MAVFLLIFNKKVIEAITMATYHIFATQYIKIIAHPNEEALLIALKRREGKTKGEKERYTHLNAQFQRIARRDKKAFLIDQCQEVEEKTRMGKTRDSSRKLETPRGHFMQRWAR